MISEKNVATDFGGFWAEYLPLLTPSFVKVFNEAYSEDLTEIPFSNFYSIPIGDEVTKHDLVAEFAFCLAETANNIAIPVEAFRDDEDTIHESYDKAIGFLKRYQNESDDMLLTDPEIEESFQIATQYHHFFEYLNNGDVIFRPKVKGAGFLGVCEGDLSIGDTLYEVKTVSRNLAGKDIKQLLVYFALQHSTGDRKWSNGGFFNPRKSLHYKFSVDHLIYRTSGGRSTTEVFQDIVDFLSYRDIEIDTIF